MTENHVVGPQLWYPPSSLGLDTMRPTTMCFGQRNGRRDWWWRKTLKPDAHQECYTYAWNDAWDVTQSDLIAVVASDNGSVTGSMAIPSPNEGARVGLRGRGVGCFSERTGQSAGGPWLFNGGYLWG